MDYGAILTAGGLATLFMQGIKWIIRKLKKDMSYEFSELFYAIGIPLINVFTPFLVFWLGIAVESPVLSMTWIELGKYTAIVAFGSLVSFFGYNKAIKPLSDYGTKLRAGKTQVEEVSVVDSNIKAETDTEPVG